MTASSTIKAMAPRESSACAEGEGRMGPGPVWWALATRAGGEVASAAAYGSLSQRTARGATMNGSRCEVVGPLGVTRRRWLAGVAASPLAGWAWAAAEEPSAAPF